MPAGLFEDDKGNTSSGRVQTTATVIAGVILALIIGVGEYQGRKENFSQDLYRLVTALTIGGAGVKGFQKFSEREPRTIQVPANPPANTAPSPVQTTSDTSKNTISNGNVLSSEEELKVVLKDGW